MKQYRLCFDLDNTLCENKQPGQEYEDVLPKPGAVEYLKELRAKGHYIIIMTARNMVTHNNNLGKVIAKQGPIVIDWLKKYDFVYDELLFGKPHADYFIDDKGITFTTFENLKNQIDI
jgi:capsule biosynthesis phosphatase